MGRGGTQYVLCFSFQEEGFKTLFLGVAVLSVLELALYIGLAPNLQRSACLCPRVLGLKACAATAYLN